MKAISLTIDYILGAIRLFPQSGTREKSWRPFRSPSPSGVLRYRMWMEFMRTNRETRFAKKCGLLCVAHLLIANLAFSQSTLETVKASLPVRDEITLFIKDFSKVDFRVDNMPSPKTLDSVTFFEGKSREFRVYVDFVNPLRFRVKAENKELDDELYKASNEYLTSAVSLLQSIGAAQDATSSGGRTGPPELSQTAKNKIEFEISDPQLAELYILLTLKDKDFFVGKDSLIKAMTTLRFEKTKESIFKKTNELFSGLTKITKLEEIDITTAANTVKSGEIERDLAGLEQRLEKLNTSISGTTYMFNGQIDDNFKNVAMFKTGALGKEVLGLRTSWTDIKTKYEALIKLFDGIKAEKEGNRFLLTKILNLRSAKRNELKLYVEKVDFDLNEKTMKISDKKTFLLNVRKYSILIPVVSSGVLYSNLAFQRYGTDTNEAGEMIVSKTEEDASELVMGAYLNLYFNTKSDYLPFLQLGVGPSSDKPLLFLGGGFGLSNKINIASGMIFTWFPELKGLQEGDVVTGTSQIEDAIKYRFEATPKFYVGININLTN